MPIRKTNVLLYGKPGTGKSAAIASLLTSKQLEQTPKLKVRFLMAETNCLYGLEYGIEQLYKLKLNPGQLSYCLVNHKATPRSNMRTIADNFKDNFQSLSASDAMKVKVDAGDRSVHEEYYKILLATAKFKGIDWVTKEPVIEGDVLNFDSDTIFVVDSLTTIVNCLVKVVAGARQIAGMDEYKDVQRLLKQNILLPFTEIMSEASLILLGHDHLGKDPDVIQPSQREVLKGEADFIMKTFPDVHGQAMNTIGKYFTETIYAWRDRRGKYLWAGKKEGVETSVRKLPQKEELEPNFSLYPIFTER